LAGFIYYFFSKVIDLPKKSVKKIGLAQYFQTEEYRASLCNIWSSFPQSTQTSVDTPLLVAKIVLSKEMRSMETAGPRTPRASSSRQGKHKRTGDKAENNLLHLVQPAGSCWDTLEVQLSPGPSGRENLPACLLCDPFCYRQL